MLEAEIMETRGAWQRCVTRELSSHDGSELFERAGLESRYRELAPRTQDRGGGEGLPSESLAEDQSSRSPVQQQRDCFPQLQSHSHRPSSCLPSLLEAQTIRSPERLSSSDSEHVMEALLREGLATAKVWLSSKSQHSQSYFF